MTPLTLAIHGALGLVLAVAVILLASGITALIIMTEDQTADDVQLTRQQLYDAVAAAPGLALALGLASLAVTLLLLGNLDIRPGALLLLAFSQLLLCLAYIDQRTRLLPDALTLPGVWVGLLVQLHPDLRTIGAEQAIAGAALGYLLPWSAGAAYVLLGRQAPIGGGDLKLSAMLGAWLGSDVVLLVWLLAPLFLLCACLPGLALGRIKLGQSLPFGPWLAMAGLALVGLKYVATF